MYCNDTFLGRPSSTHRQLNGHLRNCQAFKLFKLNSPPSPEYVHDMDMEVAEEVHDMDMEAAEEVGENNEDGEDGENNLEARYQQLYGHVAPGMPVNLVYYMFQTMLMARYDKDSGVWP
jgi:hypothetical protein